MRLLFFFLLSFAVYAQSVYDAINYNFNNDIGNSRFTSMGGAFGALGGNLSSISINPASGSVFEMSRLGGSFAIESNNIESNFNNNFNERKNLRHNFKVELYMFLKIMVKESLINSLLDLIFNLPILITTIY